MTTIKSIVQVFCCILLLAFQCSAADVGPTPVEVDTRNDDALLKAVQTEMLIGKWFSFKEGLLPIIISKTHISFDPSCKTAYSIVQSSVGNTYPDNHFPPLKEGRYVTVKIKLSPKKCMGNTLGFIQISFMTTVPNYSFAAIVEYDTDNKPIAWYDLRK